MLEYCNCHEWYHRIRHIFDKTSTINNVFPLSTEHFFFTVEVLLSSAPQIPWRNHISEHFSSRTTPCDCFR